eukprot:COSAG04_NODE_15174_length_541_cov_0.769231_1_plen_23_part_10
MRKQDQWAPSCSAHRDQREVNAL